MYCKKCGAKVCCQDNYCSRCGTKTALTLKDLRAEERKALREVKNLSESKQLPCGHYLAEYCWRVATSRYHPSEFKFHCDSPEIPEYAFEEVKVTKDGAIRLFSFLAEATRKFYALESLLIK